MNHVLASCLNCGTVEVAPAQVLVIVDPAAGGARILYACPRCEHVVDQWRTNVHLISVLVEHGAAVA